MDDKTCHDCGVKEGQIHELGCDMERCPFCGFQLIGCDCVYEKLGIDVSPGTWAYENGLTKSQEAAWETLLAEKGRRPYIQYPIVCAYCGALWPSLFMVPTAEWEHYIQQDKQDEVICRPCYDNIKHLIDSNGA